jgi:hypothetical protein
LNSLLIAQNQKEIEVMKKFLTVVLVILLGIAFVSSGCTRSKEAPEKAPAKEAPEKAPVPEKSPEKPKPDISGFVGKITTIDASLIQVKGKKAEVTFDASNPEFRGYKAVGDVEVGDTVAVEYTKDGVVITKLKGAEAEKKAEKARQAPKEEAR